MGKSFRVGTRASSLALRQVEEITGKLKRFYPDIEFDVVPIDTTGDRDKATPISDVEGSDFFTREIDDALLKGEIDFAVHSAKDLPDKLMKGLTIACTTESLDPYDCLVSRCDLRLDELSFGAVVGTSSLRRKTQLKAYREDLQIADIRGNIEERLGLVDNIGTRDKGQGTRRDMEAGIRALDAIVIAAVGLLRLGMGHRISQRIPFEIIRPHPLQGSLAVVVREKDLDVIRLLKGMDL